MMIWTYTALGVLALGAIYHLCRAFAIAGDREMWHDDIAYRSNLENVREP